MPPNLDKLVIAAGDEVLVVRVDPCDPVGVGPDVSLLDEAAPAEVLVHADDSLFKADVDDIPVNLHRPRDRPGGPRFPRAACAANVSPALWAAVHMPPLQPGQP